MLFCRLLILFQSFFFLINSFRNIISVANSLEPVQTLHNVGPDLGPNCLQTLPADDKVAASKEIVIILILFLFKKSRNVFIHYLRIKQWKQLFMQRSAFGEDLFSFLLTIQILLLCSWEKNEKNHMASHLGLK